MRNLKKIISFALVCTLIIGELPIQFMAWGRGGQAYANESISDMPSDGGLSTELDLIETIESNPELGPTADELDVKADYDWLVGERVIHYGTYYNDIKYGVTLPTVGENGCTISWSSSDESVIATNGMVTQPPFSYAMGNVVITLKATITKGEASKQKTIILEVVPLSPTDEDDVALDKLWLTTELVLNGNSADNVKTRLNLLTEIEQRWISTGYCGGCSVTWMSSNPEIITTDGSVIRPSKLQGNQTVNLTATISQGEAQDTKTFQFVVTVVEEFPLAICYDRFDNTSFLQLNGKAGTIGTKDRDSNDLIALQFDNKRIVNEAAGGSVFSKNKIQLGENLSFSTTFSYHNPHPNYTLGEGGFVFTLQPVSNTSYAQELKFDNIIPSINIAFISDYYSGAGSGQATNYGYSEKAVVYFNGDYENSRKALLDSDFTNNPATYKNVWIEYDGASKVLEIRFSTDELRPVYCNLRMEGLDLAQKLMEGEAGLDLEDVREVYAGFMGSMGNAKDKIEIGNWYFKNDSIPIDFQPYRFLDLSNVELTTSEPSGQPNRTIIALVRSLDGTPVEGIMVDFSTNFGILDSSFATTDASGYACVTLSTNTSGTALVKAIMPGGAMALAEVQLSLSEEDRLNFDNEWLTDERILDGNLTTDSITDNLTLPISAPNGSTISWETSNPDVIDTYGSVTRPLFAEGSQTVTLTATIAIGTKTIKKTFHVTVKISDQELVNADFEWLTETIILGENDNVNQIISDLILPTTGVNGSCINWSSNLAATVASNGTVTRPSFNQGDQSASITATIQMGDITLNKEFIIHILALEATEEEKAFADFIWLANEIILDGNESIDKIVSNLSLPTVGLNKSAISWASSNDTFVKNNGTINRPTYSQGTQNVSLSATIKNGSVEYQRVFHVLVVPLATYSEVIAYDNNWLTYNILLGKNNINAVVDNLNLPVIGQMGSSISWTSRNDTIIKPDGTVNRPNFTQGNKQVTLTAVISKGDKILEKTFTVIVKKLEQTGEEAFVADKSWLMASRTLGRNLSQYSVNQNLSLPSSGPNGTIIQWESDNPSVISLNGEVTIPEYSEGHKTVVLTAILINGSFSDRKTLQYTVLSKPDTFAPMITNTAPANNSVSVLWNTKEIIIYFDEEIKAVNPEKSTGNYGIMLNGVEISGMSVSILKNKLMVKLNDYLKSGENYELIIPADTISDHTNNTIRNELKTTFALEQKPMRNIEVITSQPDHKEKEVSVELNQISFNYNYSDIYEGRAFKNIALVDTSGNRLVVAKKLVGDTVTLTLGTGIKLKAGEVYEISIPANAVSDRFENNSYGKSIKFRTESSNVIPSIIGYYPKNGQIDVSVRQTIEIKFTNEIKDCNLTLFDDKGKKVNADITVRENDRKTVLIAMPFYQTLKPNTQYTVKGPYDQIGNSEVGFEMNFTTGSNIIGITNYIELLNELPLNTPMEIAYSTSISKGPEYSNIKIFDSNENEVSFTINLDNNKVILSPNSPLTPSSTYAFFIPKGAFLSKNGTVNDEMTLWCNTADPRNYAKYSFYMPSSGIANKTVSCNARWLGEISRPLKSITWDFGDGKQGSGLYPVNTYRNTGTYRVTLTLVDDMGFSYQFEKTITINGLKLSDIELSVRSDYTYLTVMEKDNPYNLKNIEKFNLYLYSPSNGYIADELIQVDLYKNGILIEHLGDVRTKYNGEAQFSFSYGNKGYFGIYELVFRHSSSNKQNRVPITISEATKKQSLVIKLYDEETGDYINVVEGVFIELNGERKTVQYENLNDGYGDVCVIKNLEIGKTYLLKLVDSEDMLYVSREEAVYHQGSDITVFLAVRKKQPGISYIKSTLSDSRTEGGIRGLFIKNISIPDLQFELSGYWDGLAPGYYELKSTMGSISLRSEKPVFELQPGLQMQEGEELWGRMVSKSGEASLWQNAIVTVAPYPSLPNGTEMDISYMNGQYIIDAPMQISELTGVDIGILDGIPLLDNSSSFGLGSSNERFKGSISDTGVLSILYKYGVGHGMSTKKSKLLTTGYEVEADIALYGKLFYDRRSKEWKLRQYIYYLVGRGEYYWKRPYTIPKIDIGGWGKVTIASNIDATLLIDGYSEDDDMKGIIEFEPYVSISIGAGIENVLSVEGYVTGSVPAEIHIPTGYIQVEPNINASIVVYYIYSSSEIYYKELARKHWDNGKEKVKLFSIPLEETMEEKEIELTAIARNYLDRDSKWLAGTNMKQNSMTMLSTLKAAEILGVDTSLKNDIMKENIYPRAEVRLINGEDMDWMVWTDDNPVRDANNRTQLRYSVYRNGNWIEPEWIGQDETADFAPTGVAIDGGMLLAWQNINNVMTEENKNVSFVKDSEINVFQNIYNGEEDGPKIIALTDDDKFDHSPVLATGNDKAILAWTKSEGLSITFGEDMEDLKSPSNSDSLFYSIWNGSSWGAPEEIEGSLPTVIDSSITMNGEEGLLLYTLDMDNNQMTQEDREVYYRIYDGVSWTDAVMLTNNNKEDSAPKAVYSNGEWFVIWYQDGMIQYQEGLTKETKTAETLSVVPREYKIAVMDGVNPQIALIYGNYNQNNATAISASFYDINEGVWSDEITLGENDGSTGSLSPIFTEDGTLKVVYTQAEVIKKIIDQVEFLSPSDKVDLMLLSYTPNHDLALDDEKGIEVMPLIPTKGTLATVTTTVINNGDFAEHATLYLYDGDPSLGKLIGSVTTKEPIAARSRIQLEVEWLVGLEERKEYEIYAVVSSEKEIHDVNEDNNRLTLKIATADMVVTKVTSENIAGSKYLAKATLANRGSNTIEGAIIQIQNKENGQILETKEIENIMPGQEINLSFFIDSKDLATNKDGEIVMNVLATLPDDCEEYTYENNAYEFILEPATIIVDRMDPAPNGKQVSITSPLSISFNMNVEKGLEFEQIELLDEELNEIEIDKVLNGKTLTITPKNQLSFDTEYALTIPTKAIGDSYGHTMEESYILNYSTTSSNPEVTFVYPGEGMTDILLDTEIKVKFNQNVMKGPTFENVTMFTSKLKQEIVASIEGEWLTIKYEGNLVANTTYSLIIPGGAVKNDIGEVLKEEYVVLFTTIGKKDDNKPDYNSEVDSELTNIQITIGDMKRDASAVINKNTAEIRLEGIVKDILSNDTNIEVNIPAIPNVYAYSFGIPFDLLTGKLVKASLTINTNIGSIRIPAGMLDGMSIEGSTASIMIAVGDKSSLKNPTRDMVGNHPMIQLMLTIDGKQIDWNNPATSVLLLIPYSPTEDELNNSDNIVVWYLDNSDNITSIPNGYYDTLSRTVTFTTNHFSNFAVGYNRVNFKDIEDGAWYGEAVNFIAARNITSGTGDGKYSPKARLSRGEFIVLLMRAYGISPDVNTVDNFKDAGNTYYTSYLAAAKRLGITAGIGNNLFAPGMYITRQEMFTQLYNILKYIGQIPQSDSGKDLYNFSDIKQIDTWAKMAVSVLVETGTISGNEGMINPNSTATRAEMAQVLYNLFDKSK